MGISYSGGMIVGCSADNIGYDDGGTYEFLEQYDLEAYSLWYDADTDGQVWGFAVKDVTILSDEFDDWVNMVKRKAQEFEEITGEKAMLIGMQDIY